MFQHKTLRTWMWKCLVYAFDVDQAGYVSYHHDVCMGRENAINDGSISQERFVHSTEDISPTINWIAIIDVDTNFEPQNDNKNPLYLGKPYNRYFCKQWRPRWNAALCCISSGSALFAEVKTIFRDRNTSKFGNSLSCDPLRYIMDNPIRIAFIHIVESIRIQRD